MLKLSNPTRSTVFSAIALIVALAAGHSAVLAQQEGRDLPTNEPSTNATLMDRTDLGNTVQSSRMMRAEATRELKRAAKLEKKLATAEGSERTKLEKKIQSAYQQAAAKFTSAIQTTPDQIDAYIGLATATSRLGEHQKSLQVYAMALKKDPQHEGVFRGWAEALLELNLLGEAVRAYSHFETANPHQAQILRSEMASWLDRRRETPGDLASEDIEKMATWLGEHG